MPALSFALSVGLVLNGLSRRSSDGYPTRSAEHTMFIAFLLEGLGIYALILFANSPILFVLFSLVYFAWGEIFALFPATCTDIYGRKFATANYGMLYTARSGRSAGPAGQRLLLQREAGPPSLPWHRRQHDRGRIGLARIEARAGTSDGEKRFVP